MNFYGVLGEKLSHSISPMIHNKIFSLLDIKGAYKIFEVEREDLKKFADSLRVLKIKGCNVTIPYKEDIMKYLDEISPEAKKIKAINTILLKNNKLYGFNSDYYGFNSILLRNNIEANDKVAMVLGTGGASKAAVTLLLDKGIKKIYLVSRSKKSIPLNPDNRIEYRIYKDIGNVKGDILINATPVGMYPNVDKNPVDEKIINNFDVLIDLIYNPRDTKFLQCGKKLNKKICGGLEMLVGQAIKSSEIWHDISINSDIQEKIYSYIDEEFR
ncbi:shikimate dehydrogenase [Clostridium cagae]|uniref:shikimate dehydrogenase n=1 Tax=Clostridium cagae TaxID=2080751 RepID=UPI0004FFCF21|nr:shikimate 5-dehydrogenase [Clostridium botulinum 202F]KAI3347610.1 shikimate dehydrogenase [Clostridium botulinum]KFX59592.1 shikimate dehydrogenase [Clostridium botulinum]KON14369.1 shikimate dehydrogenase [Clostridium botulinum]MBY6779317.1 shikimate dehydrogenase [Clostridium botulinum]